MSSDESKVNSAKPIIGTAMVLVLLPTLIVYGSRSTISEEDLNSRERIAQNLAARSWKADQMSGTLSNGRIDESKVPPVDAGTGEIRIKRKYSDVAQTYTVFECTIDKFKLQYKITVGRTFYWFTRHKI
jgi:hypothetical protein